MLAFSAMSNTEKEQAIKELRADVERLLEQVVAAEDGMKEMIEVGKRADAEVERLTNLIEARGRTMTCLSPWEPAPCPALKLEIGNRELLMTENERLRADVERQHIGIENAMFTIQSSVTEENRLRADVERMRALLEYLDRRGGLGYEIHDRINAALGEARS